MPEPSRELYAPCPHCGEPIALKALVLRAQREATIVPSPVADPTAPVPVAAAPPRPAAPTPPSPTVRSARGRWRHSAPVRIWKRYFPPVRLVWIFLAILVANVDGFSSLLIALPLLALPAIAAVADLGLQATRFPRLRFPDAAVATGFFLSLLLWPSTLTLELGAVVVATVGVRHLLRVGGHPVLNPAAVGVTLAAVLFGLPQPWHVGFTVRDTALIAALGLVLWSRAWPTWRLWGLYFVANLAATFAIADLLGGAGSLPLVFQSSVLGGAPVFFGFFMVTEPRTAPSARWAMAAFGLLVGVVAAVLPVALAESAALSALGVLAPYLALFIGNVFAATVPSARGTRRTVADPRRAPSAPVGTRRVEA